MQFTKIMLHLSEPLSKPKNKFLLNIIIFNKNWKLFIMFGGGKPQWTFLQHNGPLFPPPYKHHRVPVIVNNEEIILTPLVEEYATLYARFIDKYILKDNI